MELKKVIHTYFNELSKSQKKVATYVLEYPENVAMHSAQEVGSTIEVSETTVIRFCHSLGYSGYAELQKDIRKQLLFHESSLNTYQQTKLELEQGTQFFRQVMEQDQKMIAETINRINEEDYENTVKQLSAGKKVYVLGLRSSHAVASWVAYTLGLVREDVQLIRTESEDVIRKLSEMDKDVVVLVISFHRYVKETVKITQLAKKQGAFVIAVSDSRLAPVQPFSDVLFPIYSPNKSTLDATTSLFSFLNALIAGVSVKEKAQFEKRQQAYRKIKADFLFTEGIEKE